MNTKTQLQTVCSVTATMANIVWHQTLNKGRNASVEIEISVVSTFVSY